MSTHVSVRFGDRLLERLDRRVEAGEFKDRSEAVREATRRVCLEGELLDRASDDPGVDPDVAKQLLSPSTREA